MTICATRMASAPMAFVAQPGMAKSVNMRRAATTIIPPTQSNPKSDEAIRRREKRMSEKTESAPTAWSTRAGIFLRGTGIALTTLRRHVHDGELRSK